MGKSYRDRSSRNYDQDDLEYPCGYRDDAAANRKIKQREAAKCEKGKKKGFKDIKEYDPWVEGTEKSW